MTAITTPAAAWAGPPDTLETIETHTARVFLTADRAYKVRKPVRFAFVDYTDLESRRRAAQAEVALNRELAPGTYLAVRPLVPDVDGTPQLGAREDEHAAVDHVVEMRLFAERDTLAARVAADRLDGAMLAQLGRRLAAFHREAEPAPGGGAAHALARADRNGEELIELHRTWSGGREAVAVVGGLQTAILRRTAEFDARAALGRWRDGHGDLRADHVLFEHDGLRIVDRLEFDADLRRDDVACDLAFLLMDLEARGARDAARAVLAAYRAAGGDAGDDALVACWSAYRATVAAKVAYLGARQGRTGAEATAQHRLRLAHRLLWRTHGPRVLVVCGPPATGKSTLAAAIADQAGVTVLSSDVVRKERLGLAATDRAPAAAYTSHATAAVYGALGHRARLLAAHDGLVVVDATMHRRGERSAFAVGLGHTTAVSWVVCEVPQGLARSRAARRLADPARVSDATPAVADDLAAAWQPLDEVRAADVLGLRTDRPTAAAVAVVEGWLR